LLLFSEFAAHLKTWFVLIPIISQSVRTNGSKMSILRIFALCCIPLLGGCALIVDGKTQSVSFDTSPQKSADCSISNSKGSWNVHQTPASATINKAYGDITVTCSSRDGYHGSSVVQSETSGAVFGNIIIGGIIGVAVDIGSGAAYQYPSRITIPLAPPFEPAPINPAPISLPIAPTVVPPEKQVPAGSATPAV
jgi:hypothetical protein